ncbi:MAG: metal-binding protein, partial [Novosphingobium sp.]|nr:metal-binding protein [Novosphingobium sp.]
MAGDVPYVPLSGDESGDDAAVQRHWRKYSPLSSAGDAAERFLATAGLDRGPWLAVGLAAGIALWFVLGAPWQWIAMLAICAVLAGGALPVWGHGDAWVHLRMAIAAMAVAAAVGMALVWARSAIAGTEPVARPMT